MPANTKATGRKVPKNAWKKGQSGNPKGRPKDGESWAAIIKSIGDMYPMDIVDFVGKDNDLGRALIKFPKDVQMKYLVTARVFAALMFEPTAGLWNSLMERSEGKVKEAVEESNTSERADLSIPAEMIAPDLLSVYRDIKAGNHTEYALDGGRGSTKSSFVALVSIMLLVNNPSWHMLVIRKVDNTIRKSVYSQLTWAINELGVSDKFKSTLNPLEIQYIPTGQRIYFAGAADPTNLKSIKPPFGHIALLWFEEFDQLAGEAQVRNIVQSALRGGDVAYRFETWNTPRSKNHWTNKYLAIPKETRLHKRTNYINVPTEWLGKIFLDEAEFLQSVNPDAYRHEYLGEAIGSGGLVFENVELRSITDEEIATFNQPSDGMDFGYYPDPFVWGRSYYNPAQMTIYIYDEVVLYKHGNQEAFDKIKDKLNPNILIIADSAEPKSIADFKKYGANIRGAEKGQDSVDYSMKWLASRARIVIDPVRAPHHAKEFIEYELEQTKDGEYITAYPDKNNHTIDRTRYAHNLLWRRAGE